MNVICFDDVMKEIEKNDMHAMMNEAYEDYLQETHNEEASIELAVGLL